jgi:hypothetical protein
VAITALDDRIGMKHWIGNLRMWHKFARIGA